MVEPGTYLALGRTVFRGAQIANAKKKDHKEIGQLVYTALMDAVCPSTNDAEGAGQVVEEIEPLLKSSPIPGEERGSLWERTKARSLRFFGVYSEPSIRLSLPPLHDRLEEWVAKAAEDQGVQEALASVTCNEAPKSSEQFGKMFREAFRQELNSNPTPGFRETLLARLAADQGAREYQKKELRESAGELAVASGITGAATFGAVDVVAGDPAIAGLVAGGASLLVLVGGTVREVLSRGVTPIQQAVRDAVRGWIADFLAHMLHERGRTALAANLDDLKQGVMRALQAEEAYALTGHTDRAPRDADQKLPAEPPPQLLADLSERIIPRSQGVDDDLLTAALYQLEDRLIRWDRAPIDRAQAARRDLYHPLLEVLESTEALAVKPPKPRSESEVSAGGWTLDEDERTIGWKLDEDERPIGWKLNDPKRAREVDREEPKPLRERAAGERRGNRDDR